MFPAVASVITQAMSAPRTGKKHNMLTQLAEWTRLGFITRTSAGTYALDTPP
jgi:hypothetical protein